MKPYNKLSTYCMAATLTLVMLTQSCQKVMDIPNRGVIVPDGVWKDPKMIKAFLSDIYARLIPGWPFNGNDTDEGFNAPNSIGNYQRGIINVTSTTSDLNYDGIERINFFLDKLNTVPASVLPDDLNKRYAAEASFWRAWAYWGMVKQIGGVPIILKPQDATNPKSLYVPRNKTSECIAQIVSDLDQAIAVLPAVYPDAANDYGRITKVAAMAVKGRVLMTYASPLFNPTNSTDRWQAAYDINKAAIDAADANYGLYPNFKNIWYDEGNKEVIMVNKYAYPNHTINFNTIRPMPMTKDATGNNQLLLSLLLAFPKKDGSPMQFDKDRLSDAAYNAQFLTDFYMNRDKRFYTTVFFGGEPYPTPDEVPPVYVKGNSFWNVWQYDAKLNTYLNLTSIIHSGMSTNLQNTGFFDRKGLDTTLTSTVVGQGQTDWIEIRYTELKMNFAECANELSKTDEAITVLHDIRNRAGIAAGADGKYGITATSKEDVREAIIKERQVEFAFESKRFDDLRRWKRYDILNSQGARHGLYVTLNNSEITFDKGSPISTTIKPSDKITDATVRAKFKAFYIESLDWDPSIKFKLDEHHWFYALKPSQISQSKGILQQNVEWGGTFDPLQ